MHEALGAYSRRACCSKTVKGEHSRKSQQNVRFESQAVNESSQLGTREAVQRSILMATRTTKK